MDLLFTLSSQELDLDLILETKMNKPSVFFCNYSIQNIQVQKDGIKKLNTFSHSSSNGKLNNCTFVIFC